MVDLPNYCQTLATNSGLSPFDFHGILGEANWTGVVWLGLLASMGGLALVYALSQWLRLPKLEAWTKFEMFQLLATGILAVLLAGWVFGMCHWDASILSKTLYQDSAAHADLVSDCTGVVGGTVNMVGTKGQDIITPFCVAQHYLTKVKARGDDIFQLLITVNYGTSYLFKTVWESRPLGIGYTLEPLAGFQQLQNVFLVAVSGFTVSYLSVLIQMRILDFFLLAVPYYFLPLGLLLRAFPPTREFGGAIVGFGIASLLFYPLILVMNDVVVYSSLESVTKPIDTVLAAMDQGDVLIGTFNAKDNPLGKITEGQRLTVSGQDILVQRILILREPDLLEFTGTDGQTVGQTYLVQSDGQLATMWLKGKSIDPAGGWNIDNVLGSYRNDQAYDPALKEGNLRTGAGAPVGGEPALSGHDLNRTVAYFTDRSDAPGWVQTLTGWIFGALNPVMIYFIVGVMLPLINFMIYIEVAKALTKILGTEMDLSNLSRLI
jgi:hypothetical protein